MGSEFIRSVKKIIFAVSGSRSLAGRYDEVTAILESIIKPDDIVITGGAEGVDTISEIWCKDRGIVCIVIEPINKIYNLPYNPIFYLARDKQVVNVSNQLISIWDGKSRGTKFTREYADSKGKLVHLYTIL